MSDVVAVGLITGLVGVASALLTTAGSLFVGRVQARAAMFVGQKNFDGISLTAETNVSTATLTQSTQRYANFLESRRQAYGEALAEVYRYRQSALESDRLLIEHAVNQKPDDREAKIALLKASLVSSTRFQSTIEEFLRDLDSIVEDESAFLEYVRAMNEDLRTHGP